MPTRRPFDHEVSEHRAQGQVFKMYETCDRCGKGSVPCSNVMDDWACAECFEEFSCTVMGSCLLDVAIGHHGMLGGNSSGGRDEGIRLKGFTQSTRRAPR